MIRVKVKTQPATIRDLQKAGVPIISGKEFFKSRIKPKQVPKLQDVRRCLSKIKGSLGDEIIRMRNEERF